MIQRKIILVLIIAILTGVSYQLPDSIKKSTVPLIVSRKIEQDIKDYHAERWRICKLDALTRAEDYVDSIIVNKISLTVLKGIKFPNRPARPDSPKDIRLDDTTKIRPILK
jgi:hypothetical protein